MHAYITEDGLFHNACTHHTLVASNVQSRGVTSRLVSGFRMVGCICLVVGAFALSTSSLHAQQPSFEASVREVHAEKEWVHLPRGRSVVIETNLPTVRQQTLAPDIARIQSITPTQILVTGESVGRTQVIINSADGHQKIFDISVELELDLLNEAIRRVDPLANVKAYPILETVILSGTVTDSETAQQIMDLASVFSTNARNHMSVAGEQQVLIHCTIAEMSRSATRQLGINGYLFGEDFRDFPIVSNIGEVNPVSFGRVAGSVLQDIAYAAEETLVGSGSTMSFAFPNVQMQVFLRALRDNGLTRVLANPTLTAISGRSASFLAGGEFPIPVPQEQGRVTIEYRAFGARLAFTPVVLANQMIRLNIAPEVSELDFSSAVRFSGFVVPGLTSRRAETTVEIGNGQTLIIAGLLSENVRAQASKIPALGDVPVLGALFSSKEYRKNTTELVILVSPEIVAPMNPDQIPDLPGDHHTSPTDWQLMALGMIEGEPGDHQVRDTTRYFPDDEPITVDEFMSDASKQSSLLGPWGLSEPHELE